MRPTRENARIGLLIIFLLASIFIWTHIVHGARGELTVAFFDVSQGDAIFIESPSGNQMLIDGGASAMVLRALADMMPFYDRSIDIVVATHPDKDHIGGLPDVLERYSVGTVLRSGAKNDTKIFEALNQTIDEMNIDTRRAERGMVVDFGDGVYAEILFPDHDVSKITDTNDASIIIRLVYGETEFMLTGDASQKIEKYITSRDGALLKSTVLKAGHHGSKTSSSELFLAAVAPKYTVISAGKDNTYGHPHQEVIDRFRQFGATVLSTMEKGTVVFHSDGVVVKVE